MAKQRVKLNDDATAKRTPKAKVIALQSLTLAGRDYRPGEQIPHADLEALSDKVRNALESTAKIGSPDQYRPSEGEQKAARKLATAEQKLDEAREFLHRQRERREALEGDLNELDAKRESLAEAAARGDRKAQAKLERSRGEIASKRDELRETELATRAAEKGIVAAEAEVAQAERERAAQEAERLIGEHVETCRRLQKEIEKVSSLVLAYNDTRKRFANLVHIQSRQIVSDWRLKALLDQHWGLSYSIHPSFRFKNLAEVEERLLRGLASRWAKRESAR